VSFHGALGECKALGCTCVGYVGVTREGRTTVSLEKAMEMLGVSRTEIMCMIGPLGIKVVTPHELDTRSSGDDISYRVPERNILKVLAARQRKEERAKTKLASSKNS
jgi:hypothetical protein